MSWMATQQGLAISTSRDARIAGALYFAWLMMGCVRSVYVEFAIVGGDSASRAARIADHG